MFCPNCRSQVVDGAEFCPNCGANLKQMHEQVQQQIFQQPVYNQQSVQQQPINNKNCNKKFVLVAIIIVIVLAVVAVVGVSKLAKKDTSKTNNTVNSTETVDSDTNLSYDKDGAFLMAVEDAYTITGRGTVVTGRVERGTIKLNDEVQIIGLNHEIITTIVTNIEMSGKLVDYAEMGDNVGILLKDVSRDDVEIGQVLAKPNSIKAATKFDADVYVLTKEEGGRLTPLFNNYKPQFYFKTADITGLITLPKNVEKVNPGNNSKMTVELVSNVAMEVGTEFDIKEGGRIIAKGTVTKVY